MAQFDSLIIFPLIWSSLFVLFLHYTMSIKMLIPHFFGAKKFREKKLDSPVFYGSLKSNIEVKSDYSYNIAS
uniref:ATPase subunit 8 n=1 Tax=Berkeleya fennica TaxID=1577906 RepID=A0A0U1XY65_BERFE|nr:ATPase subunit 8 [Berkeleya fennica]AJA05809.1 ATPase subunit 8 [Berkeleya fennica]